TDAGKTWTRIDSGLPDGAWVHAVREDTVDRNLLFAATETGVFVSFDDGAHWQSLQINLPRSPVHDLVVKGDDLVVATHGRSFWILDNITPLRQVAEASAAADLFLYTPQTATRLYYPDQVDARPPVGQNPPAGVMIDYYLPSKATGPISMEIADSTGAVVRHLSSVKSNKAEQPPEWPDQVHPTETLPSNTGMNRYVWNLRYDDPTSIPGAFYSGLPPRGPIALPGKYTIKVTYNGKTQTVPLTLVADPRDKGPLTGLQQKFALAKQVYQDQDALHRAVNDINAAMKEVNAAVKSAQGKPKAASLATQGNAVLKQAQQILGVLMQVNIKGSEANLNYPGMLNEQIYSFATILDDSDTAPNAEELQTYATFHSKLANELAAWENLKKTQLAAFRTAVKAGG
ncbi:MAG TPA: hypothetical protein VLV55_11340, partial [Rhizomicrobium sp.]|nr:hypothetical protein [Rhizomicrobium sp.]